MNHGVVRYSLDAEKNTTKGGSRYLAGLSVEAWMQCGNEENNLTHVIFANLSFKDIIKGKPRVVIQLHLVIIDGHTSTPPQIMTTWKSARCPLVKMSPNCVSFAENGSRGEVKCEVTRDLYLSNLTYVASLELDASSFALDKDDQSVTRGIHRVDTCAQSKEIDLSGVIRKSANEIDSTAPSKEVDMSTIPTNPEIRNDPVPVTALPPQTNGSGLHEKTEKDRLNWHLDQLVIVGIFLTMMSSMYLLPMAVRRLKQRVC